MPDKNNTSTDTAPPDTDQPVEGDEGEKQKPIDLQALAEKVFALMQQDLRIERERMGRRT